MTDYIKIWTCVCDEDLGEKSYVIDFLANRKYCQDCGKKMQSKSYQEMGLNKED